MSPPHPNLLSSKNIKLALAGLAQWIECWPVYQSVAGLIPGHSACFGCGSGPWLGVCKKQPHIDVSLPLSIAPFLSL